ncbi:hypothetical protein [Streptomyces sp. NPDC005181]|uniref:hypothetical protein n=1 Tax=Streptomyces sp. NPDC005181 TaxID=3156869 RepID=UPI0033A19D9F
MDPDDFTRLLIAIREGGLAQSYVEPDRLPPGQLERQFLAPPTPSRKQNSLPRAKTPNLPCEPLHFVSRTSQDCAQDQGPPQVL